MPEAASDVASELPINDAPRADAEPDPNAGLIRVAKGGEHIHVHPSNLDAHRRIGWRIA